MNVTGVGALLCPPCFGFERLAPAIFIETQASEVYRRVERRGGQTLGISFLDWVIVLSPHVRDGVAITHELTHVELHNRLGPKMFAVPAWFDEGLAVNVSDDPHYVAPPVMRDRCLI